MKTAEEFLKNSNNINYNSLRFPNPLIDIMPFIEADLIDFAKMHVEEALKRATKEAWAYEESIGSGHKYTLTVEPESILGAYPLENIK